MRSLIFLLAFLWFACAQNSKTEKHLPPLGQLANKTPDQLLELVGPPDSVFVQFVVTKQMLTHHYRGKDYLLEIQFPKGMSTDLIVVNPPVSFDKLNLEIFGLRDSKPTEDVESAYKKWRKIEPFKIINAYVTNRTPGNRVLTYSVYFKSE